MNDKSNILEKLHRLVEFPGYQPLNEKALARKLKIAPEDEPAFAQLLEEEERLGQLACIRGELYVKPLRAGLLAGKISMNERGSGFLLADEWDGPDVYIGAGDTHTAMHGDRVLVRLNEIGFRHRRDERRTGKVIRILERARTQIVGKLQKTEHFYYVVPDDTRVPHDIYVPEPRPAVPLGHKVVVRLKEWASRHVNPEGEVTEVLGPPDRPGIDMLSILRRYELPEAFPEEVEAEAREIPTSIPPDEIRRREDFRGQHVITIDPDDARDFDDALSCRPLDGGGLEVFIHIADVSHYVRPGSRLDKEARERGNSTYLVDRVLPMLPEKLSNGICSLHPHADRLVKTVVVKLGAKGDVRSFRFAEGVIHSRQRLTYREAMSLIENPGRGGTAEVIQTLHGMAQRLRQRRMAAGSLDLDFPEVKVRLDEAGRAVAFEKIENDASHQLIEEFMLLANEVVAQHLKHRHIPAVYRVHENPDPLKLDELSANLRFMGLRAGNLNQKGEVQKLLRSIKGTKEEAMIKVQLLRSLARAVYMAKPVGHFGLAKANYTHFTSPIRRYADLLVHRALFGRGEGARDTDTVRLARTAKEISDTERNSADAEFESKKMKKLEYFAREGKGRSFEAVVQEVRSMGLIVELPDYQIQGLIRLSDLEDDFYEVDTRRMEIRGLRTKRVVKAGDRLLVAVKEVDFVKNQIRFGVAKGPGSKRTARPASKNRGRHAQATEAPSPGGNGSKRVAGKPRRVPEREIQSRTDSRRSRRSSRTQKDRSAGRKGKRR